MKENNQNKHKRLIQKPITVVPGNGAKMLDAKYNPESLNNRNCRLVFKFIKLRLYYSN